MGYEYFELLLYLTKKDGLYNEIISSTSKIAHELNTSQQTISRKLREMEQKNLIERTVSPRGLTLLLTEEARNFLKQNYLHLAQIFTKKAIILQGIVQAGIGEGKYYVGLKKYQEQFKRKIGFVAYPGTLNLEVKKSELLQFIANLIPITIYGFKTENRSYGSLICYKSSIKKIVVAIVIPERSTHKENVIEIIAPIYLREKFNLKDGDTIELNQ